MRALTVTQPWAALIVLGIKRIENRGRNAIPGEVRAGKPFAIHAGKHVDRRAFERIYEIAPALDPYFFSRVGAPPDAQEVGERFHKLATITSAVIGTARYDGTVIDRRIDEPWRDLTDDDWRWFFGPYGHILRDATRLSAPVPCKGMLGFWTLDGETERKVRVQLEPIDKLIARSSIGAGLQNIRENGIEAELADLEKKELG